MNILKNNVAHHITVNEFPLFLLRVTNSFRLLSYQPKFTFWRIKKLFEGVFSLLYKFSDFLLETLQRNTEWLGNNSGHSVSLPRALDEIVT